MIRSKYLTKFMAIAWLIFTICQTPGVNATWSYSQGSTRNSTNTIHIGFFEWQGAEVLPEDGEHGEDHKWLIENILNGTGVGINTTDSRLLSELEYRDGYGRDYFGSVAVKNSDEINELLGNEAKELSFIIQEATDPVSGEAIYYVYTTSVYLGERGSSMWLFGAQVNTKKGNPTTPIGNSISPIYRTTLKQMYGKWTATLTEAGSATSAWYDENQNDKYKNATQIPSFDPNTWVANPN